MAGEIMIETKKLTKVYGKGDTTVIALNRVDFQVRQGEFVAVTGASGSGKSTLLHMLGAMDAPTSGRVITDGTDVFSQKNQDLAVYRRRKVGFVFQFFNLIPVMTVKENILLPLMLDHALPDEAYFNDIVEMLGLKDRLTHFPNELSGGQQRENRHCKSNDNKTRGYFSRRAHGKPRYQKQPRDSFSFAEDYPQIQSDSCYDYPRPVNCGGGGQSRSYGGREAGALNGCYV